MRIKEQCLPCLINQVIKTANMTGAENRDELYRKVFALLAETDFESKTNPEVIGGCYRFLKEQLGCDDPYRETKQRYNELFLRKTAELEPTITTLEDAVKYAIVANIIDFNPIHGDVDSDIDHFFSRIGELELTINHTDTLAADIGAAKQLLYIGDNCGEICFDKLLIHRIKTINPNCKVYFAVRGEAVVNDNTVEDAEFVGMNEVAEIISNGDCSLGTVLERTSHEFREVYSNSDVVIAKGQANYESLSAEDKGIYFLLMTKCAVIAEDVGVPEKSLICLKNRS